MRHEVMDLMFENPTILEDLDFLFKDESARRMMVFYQNEEKEVITDESSEERQVSRRRTQSALLDHSEPGMEMKNLKFEIYSMPFVSGKKILFTTDGSEASLTNVCIYFLRLSTKKYLGEETFQVKLQGYRF